MNEPTVQIALPAFSRSMKTLSVLLGGCLLYTSDAADE